MLLRLPPDIHIGPAVLEELRKLAEVSGPPCIIYVRMSRDRTGAFLGIDRQLKDAFKLIRQLGLRVVGVYADNDMSAYSGKPLKDQLEMLAFLKDDGASHVITWHTDRLYRIPDELENYIRICDPKGIITNTVTAGPLDLSTPSGRMAARVHCAVARYEVEHAIERRKSANQQKAEAGIWLGGRRPTGWEADGVTPRVHEQDYLEDAGLRVLVGESCRALARELNEAGHRTSAGNEWTGSGLRDALLRPRNAGLMVLNDEIVGDAEWRPLFHRDIEDPGEQRERARETWEAIRAVLMDPARGVGRSRGRLWLGTGLYLCGVHDDGVTTMTSGRQRKKPAYKCRVQEHLKPMAEPIDDIVERSVVAYLQDERNWPRLMPRDPGGELARMRTEATSLRARLDQLDDELDDGVITKDRWMRRNQRMTTRLKELDEVLIQAAAGSALRGVPGPDLAYRWYGREDDRSDGFSLERRAAIIQAVCTVTVLPPPLGRPRNVHPSQVVRIVWRDPE